MLSLFTFILFFHELLCTRCFTDVHQNQLIWFKFFLNQNQISYMNTWGNLTLFHGPTLNASFQSICPWRVFLLWFLSFVWRFCFLLWLITSLPSQSQIWKNHLNMRDLIKLLVLFQVTLWMACCVVVLSVVCSAASWLMSLNQFNTFHYLLKTDFSEKKIWVWC